LGDHVDATKIEGNELFASCADGTLSVVKETAPGKFAIVQTVQTEVGARTMGIDPTTHTIYLPTADYEVSDTTTVRQPHIKPGTFKILVVTRER
jgi:hypothetical protein